MQKYKLESFELSQAYLFFWDKLEKANWFLEQIIDTADTPLDDRLVQTMMHEPISDGGQWDMVFNLVTKYGLVPQVLYPDSANAKNSGVVNKVVVNKLREYALKLRKIASGSRSVRQAGESVAAALSRAKEQMMKEIHTVLVVSMGPPPPADAEFAWTFTDSSGKTQTVRATPRDFAADIYSADFRVTSEAIAGMTSLVNDPRHDMLSLLTVDRLGNIIGGRGITYVNVDMAAMKRACIAQLRAGMPVFFGSDVGKFSNSASGIMDLDLYHYELGFGVGLLGMSKADRLRTGESAMTHAMVLTAVHIDDETGEPVRWRVQNSWGEDAGEKGWFVMTDKWMDEFVYQAVIDPRFLTKEEKAVIKQDPVILPLWDPMGSLA
jgi:bleomycin hydrolase